MRAALASQMAASSSPAAAFAIVSGAFGTVFPAAQYAFASARALTE